MDEEYEIVEVNFLVNWTSPSIYDIYPKKDDLLKKVSLSVDIVKFVEENDVYHVLDESSKSEVFELGSEEISFVDFFGIEEFLLSSPNNDFDIGFCVMEENFYFRGREKKKKNVGRFL